MKIDIGTITLTLIISYIIQAILMFLQCRLNKSYRGIKLIALGSTLYATSFIFIMMQGIVSNKPIIFIGNMLLLLAIIFQYIGLMRFLEIKEKMGSVISIFTTCFLLFIYFTYVNNCITARVFVINTALAMVSLLIAWGLLKNKISVITSSTNFLLVMYLFNGCFLILRALLAFFSTPLNSALDPALLQILLFLELFIMTFVITFIFIFMINQRLSAEIREVKENFEQIFRLSPDATLITRLHDGSIVNFNHSFLELSGYNRNEVIGKNVLDMNIYENDDERQKILTEIGEKGFCKNKETIFRCKDGSIITSIVSAEIIMLHGTQHIISITHDITERKKSETEVLYLSYHDQLTGLYNRRFYEEELDRLDVERNLPITLVMADVNGLKLTNDAFGHLIGDELLKNFASILKKEARGDDIVARTGGDEFLILLPKTDSKQTERIVNRIKASMTREKTNKTILSVSFGWGTKDNNIEDIEKVYIKAEDHMYRKKLLESTSMKNETIKLITKGLYQKNEIEQKHCERVSKLCKEIGKAMGLNSDVVDELGLLGLLHDIGNIGINEKVLNKLEKLTKIEWSEIKRHPEIGYQILRSVNEFAYIAEYVLSHHERLDGQGYPRNLKHSQIPLQAKILSIIDAYDAMTSDRPYRKALTEEKAFIEIRKNSGTQFDPEIARVFVEKILNKPWE